MELQRRLPIQYKNIIFKAISLIAYPHDSPMFHCRRGHSMEFASAQFYQYLSFQFYLLFLWKTLRLQILSCFWQISIYRRFPYAEHSRNHTTLLTLFKLWVIGMQLCVLPNIYRTVSSVLETFLGVFSFHPKKFNPNNQTNQLFHSFGFFLLVFFVLFQLHEVRQPEKLSVVLSKTWLTRSQQRYVISLEIYF